MIKELVIGGLLAGVVCGCSNMQPAALPSQPAPPAADGKLQIRNNAASLLSDLLKQEQNVGKVLIIKDASPRIAGTIKLIAATAAAHERELEEMAAKDPALILTALDLPPGEVAAREGTATTTKHALLFSSSSNFEFNLLYSQAQAESYGWHLAAVAASNCSQPKEAQVFNTISQTMERLNHEVLDEMRALNK